MGFYNIIDMSAHLRFWVLFLEVRESPSHYFFWSETARPQIGLWQKIRVNPNFLVFFFTVATPTPSYVNHVTSIAQLLGSSARVKTDADTKMNLCKNADTCLMCNQCGEFSTRPKKSMGYILLLELQVTN